MGDTVGVTLPVGVGVRDGENVGVGMGEQEKLDVVEDDGVGVETTRSFRPVCHWQGTSEGSGINDESLKTFAVDGCI